MDSLRKLLKPVLVAAVFGLVSLGTTTSATAQRSAYWNNHWGWYDNTYRPYYNTYYAPTYTSPYYAPTYGYGYVAPAPYYGYGYRSYYGPAYVPPRVGVRTGPVTFGWW